MLPSVNRGIQIGTIVVVTPGDEPAVQLIEEEEVSYRSRLSWRSSSGLFPIVSAIDGPEHEKVLSVDAGGAGDPPKLRRQEKQVIDETYIRNLGFHPGAASVIRTKELLGQGAIAAAVINHLYPLQELLGHALPMLTAVPRTDHLWLVFGCVPPSDPTAHCVQEREGGGSVRVCLLLPLL